MSQQSPLQDLSFVAAVDLSDDSTPTASKRYRALKLTSTETEVTSITGVSDEVIGIQQNLPESGEFVDVATRGTSKVRAAGAFAVGALIKIDAAGKFVNGGAGADRNWGRALQAAAADGDIVEADLFNAAHVT